MLLFFVILKKNIKYISPYWYLWRNNDNRHGQSPASLVAMTLISRSAASPKTNNPPSQSNFQWARLIYSNKISSITAHPCLSDKWEIYQQFPWVVTGVEPGKYDNNFELCYELNLYDKNKVNSSLLFGTFNLWN